jgi:hypothetical protein
MNYKPISPQMTELQNQDARLVMADRALKREIEELNAKDSRPNNAGDSDALNELVIADPDNFPTASDNAAKIKTAWQKRAAIEAARQSIKPKLKKTKDDAATAILASPEVQKKHGDLMKRIAPPLAEIAKAWAELYSMSLEIREHDLGFRCSICEVMPLELFGFPNTHGPLGAYLNAAVKAGYIKSSDVPKEYLA